MSDTAPLSILVLTPDFPPQRGGIQLLMERLVTNLHGCRPQVVTLGGGTEETTYAAEGVEVVRVGSGLADKHRREIAGLNVAAVRRGLREPPDCVVVGHVVLAPAAAAIRSLRRVPVIQYLHADEFRHRARLLRFALRRSDAAIAVSRHTKAMALDLGAEEESVRVIHPGVDLPADAVAEPEHAPPTIVTVARLVADYKGHDVMIRALARVRAQVPDVRWAVIGDGPLRPALEALALEEGVADAVRFLGRVSHSERDAWLARASVFAMPSRLPESGTGGEGFGIVYLEASAHGLPVVAGNVAGALDAVADGETGVLVDPTSPDAVADALIRLLTDPDRARALGAAGRRRAADFSWAAHARAVERLIRELSAQR